MKNLQVKIKQPQRGTTIVELIIYMGLLLVLIAVFTQIFSSLIEVQLESQTTSFVEQDHSYMLARVQYDVRRADGILLPLTEGNTNSSLELLINGVTYVYSLQGSNLVLEDGTGEGQINSSETQISDVSFSRVGNVGGKPTILVTMEIESRGETTRGKESRILNATIGTR